MLEVSGSVVRLDNSAFFSLVNEPDAPKHHEVLAIPGMREGLRAVRQPLIEIDVLIAGVHDIARHHAWLGEGIALFLLTVKEPARQLLVTTPGHVPSGLARILRLGPRAGGVREPITVDGYEVESVFAAEDLVDRHRREAVFQRWGADGAWSVVLTHDDQERRIILLDDPTGLRLVLPDPDPPTPDQTWQAVPISPTTAWRQLCALLPSNVGTATTAD